MDRMTCGERIACCLTGKPTDRTPFGVGLGWAPWGETLDRWKRETGKPNLDVHKEIGKDLAWRLPKIHWGIFPKFPEVTLEKTNEYVVFRDARGITMRNRLDGGSMPEFLDYPVKTEADWQRLKKERLDPNQLGRFEENWPEFRKRLQTTGEAVQVGTFPYGVFGTPRDLLGAERLLYGFYDEPNMIRDMMEHLTTLWLSLWERIAAEVQIGHIHIWEDMSGKQGSLISPPMVREFMMPRYDRIVAFAKRHQVPVVSVDTDGDCSDLVPVMTEHGINMFFPFEVQAGNDVLQYRRKYPTLGIIGGLDKRALAESKTAIDLEVEKAAKMIEQGRYVPAFDHLIPPDVSWENFLYAAEQIKKLCYNEAPTSCGKG